MLTRILSIIVLCLLMNSAYSQVSGITSSNLPLLVINTNKVEINDVAKIQATMKLISNGIGKVNKPTDPGNNYDGYIGIEVRGASSSTNPQRPFGIETRDISGKNQDVSLLGMPKENDWILLANYNDKTFMRNVLAYSLFEKMGHYAPRTRMVEVILNNSYQGIYILTEKIKRDKGRVNIAKLTSTDVSGDAITGGYIFKIDYYNEWDSWISNYAPFNHPEKAVTYVYADPSYDELVLEQKDYLKETVNSFEKMLASRDFADKTNGYASWIDVKSFIDYFIVNEVSRNVDGFKKSFFFYKDKSSNGGKINAGPVWDFDWAWKNIYDCTIFQATDGSGWSHKINDCPDPWPNSNDWMVKLLQDPDFANVLNKRYFELRNSYLSSSYLNSFIDSVQNMVGEAQVRHYKKWNILSVSVGAPEVGSQSATYAGQVSQFRWWIQTRLNWLDANMLGESTTASADQFQFADGLRIFPNPASDLVNIEGLSEIQEMQVFNSNGKSVFRQSRIFKFSTRLDVSGLTSGIYLVCLKVKGNKLITNKLVVR